MACSKAPEQDGSLCLVVQRLVRLAAQRAALRPRQPFLPAPCQLPRHERPLLILTLLALASPRGKCPWVPACLQISLLRVGGGGAVLSVAELAATVEAVPGTGGLAEQGMLLTQHKKLGTSSQP